MIFMDEKIGEVTAPQAQAKEPAADITSRLKEVEEELKKKKAELEAVKKELDERKRQAAEGEAMAGGKKETKDEKTTREANDILRTMGMKI